MPRQQLDLQELVIPANERESNSIKLHGDAVILTVYAPELTGTVFVQVTADGDEDYVTYAHKGALVKLAPSTATDVPIPACKSLRVVSSADEDEERVFHVLELLEM